MKTKYNGDMEMVLIITTGLIAIVVLGLIIAVVIL